MLLLGWNKNLQPHGPLWNWFDIPTLRGLVANLHLNAAYCGFLFYLSIYLSHHVTTALTCIGCTEKLHNCIVSAFTVQHILFCDWMFHQDRHPLPGRVKGQGVQHLKDQIISRREPHRHTVRAAAQQNEAICFGCVHQGCFIWTLCLIGEIIWACFGSVTLGWNVQRTRMGSCGALQFYSVKILLQHSVLRNSAVSFSSLLPGEDLQKRACFFGWVGLFVLTLTSMWKLTPLKQRQRFTCQLWYEQSDCCLT